MQKPLRALFGSLRGRSLFHSGQPRRNILLETDSSKAATKFYHTTGYVLAVLTPVAFVLSPSKINLPVDITLGILFPIHSHIALNYIVSDYIPQALKSGCRAGLLGITGITLLGLLKLNLFGQGLTESLKSLWRTKK